MAAGTWEVKNDRNSKSAPEFTTRKTSNAPRLWHAPGLVTDLAGKFPAKVALQSPCVALTYDWINENVLADGALEIAALQHRLGGMQTARGCGRGKWVVGAHALMHR